MTEHVISRRVLDEIRAWGDQYPDINLTINIDPETIREITRAFKKEMFL